MTKPKLQVVDAKRFGALAAAAVAEALQKALDQRETVNLVLTGGRAAGPVYRELAARKIPAAADWDRVRFFWGDERCVPPDHEQSNYRLAMENLLQPLGVNEDQVFRMRGEDDPEAAAAEYSGIVEALLDAGREIDLLLLGMGEDGHVASLFPGTQGLQESEESVVANHVLKLGSWRLSMTVPVLQRARRTCVFVRGARKASILRCAFAGQCTESEFPVRLLWRSTGSVTFVSDSPL